MGAVDSIRHSAIREDIAGLLKALVEKRTV
jgi:hypothetical protein